MIPSDITLHKQSKQLELTYAGGANFLLSAELLRVLSPSAEVKGHGQGQEVLQFGKADVAVTKITPCGNYAIQLDFSDGHKTGIFSWDYLYSLCQNQSKLWEDYLSRLHAAGKSRDADVQVVQIF
jgi:DUF971 family protein